MKKFFRDIHLYLSLVAGIIVMITCFTGAVLVFEKELQHIFYHDRYHVKQELSKRTIDELCKVVKNEFPGARVASVKMYQDPARSMEIGLFIQDKRSETVTTIKKDDKNRSVKNAGKGGKKGGGRPTHTAFVNPYSGEIIELYRYQDTFFYTMFALHRWLLGGDFGKFVVGTSTIFFLFILITGIVLWWPKTKSVLIQRLKLKLDGGWKRMNHDLHIVLGFYSAIFLFIFAFTGLAWSFQWFNDGIYKITGSEMKSPKPPQSIVSAGQASISMQQAFNVVQATQPSADFFSIRPPQNPEGVFSVTVLKTGKFEMQTDTYYLDQYSGAINGSLRYEDKNIGTKIRQTFKPVHLSSIFGLPSKIIGFIVCILGATFPITGIILWINRLRKKKKGKVKSVNKVRINKMEQAIQEADLI